MKELEKLRDDIRVATCKIEEWIEQNQDTANARHLKRLDKAVFMIKIGAKILKLANRKAK